MARQTGFGRNGNFNATRLSRGHRRFWPGAVALEERSLLSSLAISESAVIAGSSGITPMVFKVSLSPPSTVPVTVSYSTVNFHGL